VKTDFKSEQAARDEALKDLLTTVNQRPNDAEAEGPGAGSVFQYFVFLDRRIGATDVDNPFIIRESGFQVTVTYQGKPNNRVVIQRIAEKNNGAMPGGLSRNAINARAVQFK
jgi:hypothetical protein